MNILLAFSSALLFSRYYVSAFLGTQSDLVQCSLLHTICSCWDNYIILNVDIPIRKFAFSSNTSVLLYAREISHARMTFSGCMQSALCWASAIHRCKCLKSSEVNIVISPSETSPVTTFVLKKKSYCVINPLCVILIVLPHNSPIRTELTL